MKILKHKELKLKGVNSKINVIGWSGLVVPFLGFFLFLIANLGRNEVLFWLSLIIFLIGLILSIICFVTIIIFSKKYKTKIPKIIIILYVIIFLVFALWYVETKLILDSPVTKCVNEYFTCINEFERSVCEQREHECRARATT